MPTDRLAKALALAIEIHSRNPIGSTGLALIAQGLGACATVIEYHGSEDEAIAALLHQTLVNRGGTLAPIVIKNRFGRNVLSLGEGCGEDDLPNLAVWAQWYAGKQAFLKKIASYSEPFLRVTSATTLQILTGMAHRESDVGSEFWEINELPRWEFIDYYGNLVVALAERAHELYQLDPESDDVEPAISMLVRRLSNEIESLTVSALDDDDELDDDAILELDDDELSLLGYIDPPSSIQLKPHDRDV